MGYLSLKNFPLPNLIKIGFKFIGIKIVNQVAPYGFAKRGKKTFLLLNNGVLITCFLLIG